MNRALSILPLLLTALLFIIVASELSSAENPPVRIGIVTDMPLGEDAYILDLFKKEITDLLEGDFEALFPPEKMIQGDWTLSGIQNGVDALLEDPQVDVLLTVGLISSNYVCKKGALPKPVVAPFVIDAGLQGLPLKDGASGVKNLSYLSVPCLFREDLETFLEVVSFSNLAVVINNLLDKSSPELRAHVDKVCQEMGIRVSVLSVSHSADELIATIPEETEAVYLAGAYHLESAEFDKLVDALISRKLPSFSVMGKVEVERGVFMGMVSDDFILRIARRMALNLQRILLGEEAGSLPVAFSPGQRLSINMNTARAIGQFPPWAIMTEAELIAEKRKDIHRHLNLAQVVREAMKTNLDLAAQEFVISAGKQDVRRAWSNLLPYADLSGLGLIIDDDRAEASFGQQAEKTLTGSASLTQVLFSESAYANLSIQKRLQEARELDRERVRLDVAKAAATAYLTVLQAKTIERIQKNNLKLTRSNLEAAQVREAIGLAGPAEVYRWEAEIATSRKAVIEANSLRNVAEMELNRVLARPLEEPFTTVEADLSDPALLLSNEQIFQYIDNPWTFDNVRDYLVETGLENSPELAGLDALIEATKRRIASARNAYYSPTLALQGDISRLWWEDGAGTEGLDPGQLPVAFPEADNTNWSIGLNLSFPLFSGGSRRAEYIQANEELKNLELQRKATADRLEQRIRTALHISGASYAAINLSEAGAEAARQSLELVQDAYGRGTVSILELLDAQNTALVADQLAANAVYNYLDDYMEVQRAVGSFDVLSTEAENLENLNRLEEYLRAREALPGGNE